MILLVPYPFFYNFCLLLSYPFFVTFLGPCLNKMTTDSNAGALDAALDTAISFADLAPTPDVIKYAAGEDCKIFPNVVDKAFQGKSSTIAKYVLARVW